MAAWVCRGCTAVYSVGAPACPQCGSSEHAEQGVPDPQPGDEVSDEEDDADAEDHGARGAE